MWILNKLDGLNLNGVTSRYYPLSMTCFVNVVVMCFLDIQVRWDEASSIPRPERVSPWQIEPAVSPPPVNPLPVHRPKRPRSNAVASLPESSAPTKEGLTLSCVQKLVLPPFQIISCFGFFRYITFAVYLDNVYLGA